jgi:hypothetical protein
VKEGAKHRNYLKYRVHSIEDLRTLLLSERLLYAIFSFIFIARLIYVIFVIDPHSGQDAPSFSADAIEIIRSGPFSPLQYAPWWPVGYSWFVSFWWGIFGVDSRILGVAQTALLFSAQILSVKLVKMTINKETSQIFGYLIIFNFALFSSSGQLMYEVPLASFLILGAYNLRALVSEKRWSFRSASFSGLCFGLAILMHPSGLAPALVLITVALLGQKLTWKLGAQVFLVLTLLLSGVFLQVARNQIAGDGFGFSTTTFSNAQLGGWGTNNPAESLECEKIGTPLTGLRNQNRWDNPTRQICLYKVTIEQPSKLVEIFVFNSKRYWSPFVGILKGGGTWYHGLDWRRLVNSWYTWWEGTPKVIDLLLGYMWMFLHLTLACIGVRQSLVRRDYSKQNNTQRTLFFFLPVLTTYLLSVLTLGDTRHRMPTMFFYEVLVAVGIVWVLDSIVGKRKEKGKLA